MTDTPDTGSDVRAQVAELIESVKDELAARLDQLLDELGALIGGD
jgi:hypothetical protein